MAYFNSRNIVFIVFKWSTWDPYPTLDLLCSRDCRRNYRKQTKRRYWNKIRNANKNQLKKYVYNNMILREQGYTKKQNKNKNTDKTTGRNSFKYKWKLPTK